MNKVNPSIMALCVLAAGAQAQWTVTEFYDAPAVNAAASPDADPGTPGAQVTLRSVVQHINTLATGTYTVALPAGNFVLSVVGHGENNALTGDIDIRRDIEFTGAGPTSRIDASALGDRIFDVYAPARVTLRRLGLDGGTAVLGGNRGEFGGAIRAYAGTVIELSDTEFVGNSASGGPYTVGGAISTEGDLVMTGLNWFSGNTATGMGGAVMLWFGNADIDGAWFDGNVTARRGGALAIMGSCDISNTTLSNNLANNDGGAIYNGVTGRLTLLNSTISANAALNGLGGGIMNERMGDVQLTHVTMLGNRASQGDSISNGRNGNPAAVRMTHTVLSSTGIGTEGGPLTSLGYNLDADGTAGLTGVGDLSGTVGSPINPHLGPLTLNGAGTATHHPAGLGPTRDGGNPAGSLDHNGNPVTRDQRGSPRPAPSPYSPVIPDIGAVETACYVISDLAPPFGVLNFFDLAEVINLYQNQDPSLDIAPPFGVLNFFDLAEIFAYGC